MITLSQLQQWAAAGESETQEFKATTGELTSGMRSLCAMLNHRGGRVIFGVRDDGHVVGQTVSDATLRDVAQAVGRIDPPVQPEIQTVAVAEGRQVIVLTVSRGHNRPHAYDGRAYKRVGNTTSELGRDEYNRLLLEGVHADRRWEVQEAEGWDVGDLDAGEIVKTIDEAVRRGRMEDPGTRDPTELLRGLGLMPEGRLLRAAPVLFGRSEPIEQRLPQGLLRVAKFRGTDRTEFLDNRQFHGHLFALLSHAERFLRDNLPVAGRIQPNLFERTDDPLYPPIALREALANAFCHRDYTIGGGSVSVAIYDDRLEVTSSGSLHFGLTPEALYEAHDSQPWNPMIARVLYRRGLIESWGRGTQKIVETTTGAGLPPPEIEVAGGCVTVRFLPTGYVPPQRVARDVTERQQQVLSILAQAQRGMALSRIVEMAGLQRRQWTVQEDLAVLKTLGLVEVRGHGRGARWHLIK